MMTPARKEPDLTTYAGRFAVRLRALRLKAKLTPEQVAEALQVNPSSIYKWESGETSPRVEKFQMLAALYNLRKIRYLLPDE